jgi:hypothetical protein
LVYAQCLFSFDIFLIVLEDVSPDLRLPLVEVILGLTPFSVPLTVLVDPLSTELLQTLIDELANKVELLVGAVTESENSESDALEELRVLRLVLLRVTEPAIELLGVITGVTLIVCRGTHYDQGMLLELFLGELVEVEDLCRPLRAIFAEDSGQLLF